MSRLLRRLPEVRPPPTPCPLPPSPALLSLIFHRLYLPEIRSSGLSQAFYPDVASWPPQQETIPGFTMYQLRQTQHREQGHARSVLGDRIASPLQSIRSPLSHYFFSSLVSMLTEP